MAEYISFQPSDFFSPVLYTGTGTTHAITGVGLQPDFDLIGPPRLVRLNPDVLWKTRGNGAVALAFGRGGGEQMQVGELPGGPVFAHAEAPPTALDAEALLERVLAIVRAEARPSAQPGVIVSEARPPEGLYWQGVRGIVRDTQLREALEGSAHAGRSRRMPAAAEPADSAAAGGICQPCALPAATQLRVQGERLRGGRADFCLAPDNHRLLRRLCARCQ